MLTIITQKRRRPKAYRVKEGSSTAAIPAGSFIRWSRRIYWKGGDGHLYRMG